MKIYTKTGDSGETSLIGGKRVSKAELRIRAYGTVDELNAHIGLLRDQAVNKSRLKILIEIQDRLFTMGSLLASPDSESSIKLPQLSEQDVSWLEVEIDKMDKTLPPMRSFVLPGGHPAVSIGHITRTVCRRAEREVVLLSQHEGVDLLVIKYLNRLSDYFFVLCRKMSAELKITEVPWKPRL
ncbi:MAG: cob(I)yrinic acid a,c-diamide adenosyltransferase [Cyclobacteriaceae bacterium]|jgi:cob(I)alamin adenosyltransferase